MNKKSLLSICAACMLAMPLFWPEEALAAIGPGMKIAAATEAALSAPSYDVSCFVLPENARVLVAVEGTAGSECVVRAYEWEEDGWKERVLSGGTLGKNGMSNRRVEGDETTPIGVFCMNTPFGQKPAMSGFPGNYIQVDDSYVWEDDTNSLSQDLSKEGERVGSARYGGYYDYVIDAGFNPSAVEKKGAALFLHCKGEFDLYTSGCVAIDREAMIEILRLYGTYGDGSCYIAQAPAGTFDQIYDTFGENGGLSPEGDF